MTRFKRRCGICGNALEKGERTNMPIICSDAINVCVNCRLGDTVAYPPPLPARLSSCFTNILEHYSILLICESEQLDALVDCQEFDKYKKWIGQHKYYTDLRLNFIKKRFLKKINGKKGTL